MHGRCHAEFHQGSKRDLQMDLKTRAIGIRLTKQMRRDLEQTTREVLGRLQRRIRAASLTLVPDDDAVNPKRFVCDLQFALQDSAPIRVCYRGAGQAQVVVGALRRARHVLMRRAPAPVVAMA